MDSNPHGYILRTFPLTVPIFHQGSVSAFHFCARRHRSIDLIANRNGSNGADRSHSKFRAGGDGWLCDDSTDDAGIASVSKLA
jgi:hypothetical protein